MDTLKLERMKHNPSVIKGSLKQVGSVIKTTTPLRVMFPERYTTKELAFMGGIIRLVGYFAVVNDNNEYGVMSIPAFYDLTPFNVSNIEIGGDVNIVLEFEAGDVFISNTKIVKTESLYYDIFDEYFVKGKVPWYLSYEMTSDIFLESMKYSGSGIGKNPISYELLTAISSRSLKDKNKQIRHTIKDKKDLSRTVVGLNNIYYSFDNTASKLFGGYYGQGVTAAIVNKETETTAVADVLRT